MANERPRRAVDARLQEKGEKKMKHLYCLNQSSQNNTNAIVYLHFIGTRAGNIHLRKILLSNVGNPLE